LYWFNLSLKSIIKFPDLIDPITRIGREIKMLEDFYLQGDAYDYRQTSRAGRLDWDLTTITSPQAAVLTALDLAYVPDAKQRVFKFGPPRDVELSFRLPAHLRKGVHVFRIDADGSYAVQFAIDGDRIVIEDRICKVGIYLVTKDGGLQEDLERKRQELQRYEQSMDFDPADNPEDLLRRTALLDKE
jgi:hypothetical protein